MQDGGALEMGRKVMAGAVAGIIGTTCIYPVDLVKTRLQNSMQPVPMRQYGQFLAQIHRQHGLWRGFYAGLSANLLGVTPEKAIKLTVNDVARGRLARQLGVTEKELPLRYGMLAGATAGLCQCVATTPMELAKIQLQMHPQTTLPALVRSLGVRGLYRGFGATLARDVPFSIVLFPSHAHFKRLAGRDDSLAAGCAAGCLAALVATPQDVVKTRLQTDRQPQGPSMLGMYRQIYAAEGVGAFFKGAPQRCMIVAPLFGISLKVYELLK